MGRPFYAVIIPLGEGGLPGGGGNYPDQGLPPGVWPNPPGGGSPGRPDHGFNPDYPGQGLPGRPDYPSQGPVRPGWGGGERPGRGLPPNYPGRPVDPDWGIPEGVGPDQGLPGGSPGSPTHPWAPPSGEELPPPPEDIADQIVIAVWRPDTQAWKVSVAPPPAPSPHR